MRKVYLIDLENVKNAGLEGVEQLSDEESVVIFYSTKADTLKIDTIKNIRESKAEVDYIRADNGTANALDFQLLTYLYFHLMQDLAASGSVETEGSLPADPEDNESETDLKQEEIQYWIISKDRGYDASIRMSKRMGLAHVHRAPAIKNALHYGQRSEKSSVEKSPVKEPAADDSSSDRKTDSGKAAAEKPRADRREDLQSMEIAEMIVETLKKEEASAHEKNDEQKEKKPAEEKTEKENVLSSAAEETHAVHTDRDLLETTESDSGEIKQTSGKEEIADSLTEQTENGKTSERKNDRDHKNNRSSRNRNHKKNHTNGNKEIPVNGNKETPVNKEKLVNKEKPDNKEIPERDNEQKPLLPAPADKDTSVTGIRNFSVTVTDVKSVDGILSPSPEKTQSADGKNESSADDETYGIKASEQIEQEKDSGKKRGSRKSRKHSKAEEREEKHADSADPVNGTSSENRDLQKEGHTEPENSRKENQAEPDSSQKEPPAEHENSKKRSRKERVETQGENRKQRNTNNRKDDKNQTEKAAEISVNTEDQKDNKKNDNPVPEKKDPGKESKRKPDGKNNHEDRRRNSGKKSNRTSGKDSFENRQEGRKSDNRQLKDFLEQKCGLSEVDAYTVGIVEDALTGSENKSQFYQFFRRRMGAARGSDFYRNIRDHFKEMKELVKGSTKDGADRD